MSYAEFSLGPLLVIGAFFLVSSLAKKKRPGTSVRPLADASPAAEPRDGFMSELRRAMEELQQVQQQQNSLQSPGDSSQAPQTPRKPQTSQEKNAAAWLAKQQGRKALAAKGSGRVRSVRTVAPLPDADADGQSSEDVVTLEGFDYDEQAERIIAARRKAAELRVERVDASSEELSTLQQARRAGRQDLAIGGATEHAQWHDEIGKTVATAGTVRTTARLGKYADGTSRSAIILGEILGPPAGQRDR